ncbi:MAG TPA: hypothetical protein VK524_22740, partial [Polyangiaceae bacterium]|nr:hypothetical protein [Polyangiaceae bacterium]
ASSSAEADALIQQGIQLRREKRDAEALERFLKALELEPSPRVSAQIGLAELALNRWLAAEVHLRQVLASDDDWVQRNRSTLQASLDAAADRLALVEVTSNVRGAELFINGARVGTLPLPPQRVAAGNLLLELRDRDERMQRALTAAGRATLHVHVEFSRAPVANGELTPKRALAGGSPMTRDARTPAPSVANPRRTLAWMLVATGAVLLGEAVVAHVLRESWIAEYNDDGECHYGNLSREERCGRVRGKAETAQTLAALGYVGAGVAFGAAGILFVLPNTGSAVTSGSRPLGIVYRASF